MKKTKTIVAFVTAVGMLIFMGVPTLAGIMPTEYAPCINGFHYVTAKGSGTALYPDGSLIFRGQAWQCIYCNECLITEGNPTYHFRQIVGKYVTEASLDRIPGGGLVIYTNSYGYEGSTRLPGYRFIN